MSDHVLSLGTNLDGYEDLIVDAVAGLEAIFLGGEKRGKGQTIGIRAAAILEDDAIAQRKVRKEVITLYDLRSAILHGDVRAAADVLRKEAAVGERMLRRSLIAFCRVDGDHAKIVAAGNEPAAAKALRQLVNS